MCAACACCWRGGTALVLAAVLIAAAWPTLGSSVAALLAVPTPTVKPLPTATPPTAPTPYPTPTHSPLTSLGLPPRDCPPDPAPQPISPALGPVVGGMPLWVYGNFSTSGNPLTLRAAESSPGSHTLYGWPAPLLVAVAQQYTEPVSLEIWNAATEDALWFNVQGVSTSSTAEGSEVVLTVDPNNPTQAAGFQGGYVNWFPICTSLRPAAM